MNRNREKKFKSASVYVATTYILFNQHYLTSFASLFEIELKYKYKLLRFENLNCIQI